MEKLEQYLQQHDQESHSLSRSRQQRLVSTVKPARIHATIRSLLRHSLPPPPPPPPASPPRSVQRQYHTYIRDSGCSVGQELDSFIAVLKQRATLRAHELRQLRQMLIAELDWECEFNIDTRYCSGNRGDVSDEEYQALLLGEPSDQMSGYPAQQQQQDSRHSANISSQLPDDSSFDQMDLQRAQSEKRQRIQLLTRSMAQMMQRPAPSTNEVRLSSSSSGQGRRLRYYPSDHDEEVEEVRMHEAVFEEKSTVSPPPKAPTPIPMHAAAHHHRAAVGIAEQDPAERFLRRRGESIDEEKEEEEDDDSLDLFALASSRTPLRLPRTPNCDPAFS